MNNKQLELAKQKLRREMNSIGCGWIDGKYIKPPQEYELRTMELSCIDMINSILAYSCHGYTAEEVMAHEESAYRNYLADYVEALGRDKVIALIQGQTDSIDHIEQNVFVDDEGLMYNSIVWKN
jgi:hypothetical protein